MTEVIGVIASSAAIFHACLEAFELIQASRRQEQDLNKLVLKLNVEKCRLYTWGRTMGLTETEERRGQSVESFEFQSLARQALEAILRIFQDAENIKARYGCKESPLCQIDDGDEFEAVQHLANSFSNFRTANVKGDQTPTVLKRLRWVVYDRKQFNDFVMEVKALVDSLLHVSSTVTSRARQEEMMEQGIANVRDVVTLELLSEVCELEHPDLSEIALVRADLISRASTQELDIEQRPSSIAELKLDDIESMNITELKHLIITLKSQLAAGSQPPNSKTRRVTSTKLGIFRKKSLTDLVRNLRTVWTSSPKKEQESITDSLQQDVEVLPGYLVTRSKLNDNEVHGANTKSTAAQDASNTSVAVGTSLDEPLPFFKDYYSNGDIKPNDAVSVLWAYQPRAGDEFDLVRGNMLKVVGIWDDGWATGVRIDGEASDYDGKHRLRKDSGMSNNASTQEDSPCPSGEIRAFPLVCVCLPEAWKKTVEGDKSA